MGRVSDARERLLTAAIDLVWRDSYGLVSVDAICARARVRKGSFYYFFESKEALVVAALDRYWESRRPVLDAVFSASVPPLRRIEGYFGYIHQRQVELRASAGRVLGCFPSSVGSSCGGGSCSPLIAAKVQEILSLHRRYLESALRDAHAAGALAAPQPAALARTVFAYVEGVLEQARIHDDLSLVAGLARAGWALLGAAPPPAAAAPRRRPRIRAGARTRSGARARARSKSTGATAT
jgi:TetR/AcrR family transcriptional repressor of nem operon